MMTASTPRTADQLMAGLDYGQGELLTQGHQAEVRRFQSQQTGWAEAVVIKAPCGRGVRRWLSQLGLRREYAAYCRLGQLPGIATCHGLSAGHHLVLQSVEGQRLSDLDERPAPAFFDRLLALIQSMHARGVAHGDLKRKDNLLITPDGHPVILDFGTAVVRQHGFHPLNHRVYALLQQTDLNAWIKLKYGGYAGLSAADQALLQRGRLERLASAMARARRSKP